ncbi:MAG: PH domain-containing protein [Actinomycetia bacterium]|nr:PH domain-containing protein [Actinomycetes bacterium]
MSTQTGRRSHPATPLVRAWLWLLAALAWSAQSLARGDESITVVGVVLLGAVVLGLAAGYLLWAYTYFVIDGTELRIDSGIFVKRSRRMPYERIQSIDIAQPFGARILGLAELRIEMAGGEESRNQLQFLPLAEARRLRRTLLERSSAPAAEPETSGAETSDEGDHDETATGEVVQIPFGRLLASSALATDFILAIVATALLLVVVVTSLISAAFFGREAIVASIIPVGLGIVGWLYAVVRMRVFEQWGFRLSHARRGLRVDRGLFNRISQSIPIDRVQGVVIEQPVLWRLFGWYRMRVDTAGYSRGQDVDDKDATSTVLPVGDLGTVRQVFALVLPGTDPVGVDTFAAPQRSGWFAPVGWRFRRVGHDDQVAIVTRGWLTHRVDVVPHAKTQSVRLLQGPIQRQMGLADVVIDTTKGPVEAIAKDRDVTEARTLALSQLDRARAARRA